MIENLVMFGIDIQEKFFSMILDRGHMNWKVWEIQQNNQVIYFS